LLEQEKIAALGEKIRKTRRRAIIAFSLMVLFLIMGVVDFFMFFTILANASFVWTELSMVEFATIALGVLGAVLAVLFWRRMRSADREKEEYNRELHEVLVPAGFEFCPFCGRSLKS
jgi:membrane protein implicated in regulation of membrane protease activity